MLCARLVYVYYNIEYILSLWHHRSICRMHNTCDSQPIRKCTQNKTTTTQNTINKAIIRVYFVCFTCPQIYYIYIMYDILGHARWPRDRATSPPSPPSIRVYFYYSISNDSILNETCTGGSSIYTTCLYSTHSVQ